MEQVVKTMMRLIGHEVLGTRATDMKQDMLSEGFYETLYSASKAHDLAHLVGSALVNSNLLPQGEIGQKFEKKMFSAVYRYQHLNYEYVRLCETLEKAKIAFIPLKGSVIRNYYPEPWMRTSCDIDLLVHEEDLDAAVKVLCETLSYRAAEEREFHDISLFSPNGIHLELHFNILGREENLNPLLLRVWEYSAPVETGKYEHRQSNEFLLFHCLTHMVGHFINGGCGLRPFIDLHLLQAKMPYDEGVLRSLCRECGMERFYDSVLQLLQVWFGEAEHDSLTKAMEEYLLHGGVYGTQEHVVIAEQGKIGGKKKYVLHRVFMPYRLLKTQYAVLEKHKWLYPFCQIHRWFKLIFCGRLKYSVNELKTSVNADLEKGQSINKLFSDLGFDNLV